MEQIRKVFNSEIKEYDDEKMTITALISTGAVDRARESLDPEGVDMKSYQKNPVVLWAHDYSMPPIGRAVWAKKTKDGILSKVEFYKSDKSVGEFAQEIYRMYKEKFLNAFSVGFIPKEIQNATEEDIGNLKKPRRTFTKWELLEYSAVPVPANPEALQMAMQKGIIKSPMWGTILKDCELVQEFDNENQKLVLPYENKTGGGNFAIVKIEQKSSGLEDLLAENKNLLGKIEILEKDNAELRFKVYKLFQDQQQHLSEMTAKCVANNVGDVVRGVIREMQGKLD